VIRSSAAVEGVGAGTVGLGSAFLRNMITPLL
jgi:hypothetical protein